MSIDRWSIDSKSVHLFNSNMKLSSNMQRVITGFKFESEKLLQNQRLDMQTNI